MVPADKLISTMEQRDIYLIQVAYKYLKLYIA